MKVYLAPLEGVTGYTYRNTYRKFYGDADRYFTPFISPHKKFGGKVLNEISPDNNRDINLVPQLMIADYEEALGLHDLLLPLGYDEININLGCPSGTVVSKKRGSGLLRDPYALDELFEELFAYVKCPISIKTRIGWSDIAEWNKLAEIIGRYSFTEVIIHTRVREEFYNGHAHMEAMDVAHEHIQSPIIYNGDIFSTYDAESLIDRYPWLDGIMVGRGVLRDPGLIEKLKGITNTDSSAGDKPRELQFITELYNRYLELFKSEINTLYHMKEIWFYMGQKYPEYEKELKTIRKTKSPVEYQNAVKRILQ